MQQLMRQAQKMQQQMMKAQEDLDAREYEGTAGGGAGGAQMRHRPVADAATASARDGGGASPGWVGG